MKNGRLQSDVFDLGLIACSTVKYDHNTVAAKRIKYDQAIGYGQTRLSWCRIDSNHSRSFYTATKYSICKIDEITN